MSSFIRSAFLLTLAAGIQAGPVRRAGKGHLERDLKTLTKFAQTTTADPSSTIADWTGPDVCDFKAVACGDHPDGYRALSGINFNNAELGVDLSLDGFLDELTDLVFLHANSNGFTGTIPNVENLKYLYELDLSNNQLSGEFPVQVLQAPLLFLDLRFNNLTGTLPNDLFQRTDFDLLFLNNNQFEGTLPEFGNSSTLYLVLANNNFTGEIPASMAKWSKLKEVLLLGNQFTGTIPEELCRLDLDILDVTNNPGLNTTLGVDCQALADKGALFYDGMLEGVGSAHVANGTAGALVAKVTE